MLVSSEFVNRVLKKKCAQDPTLEGDARRMAELGRVALRNPEAAALDDEDRALIVLDKAVASAHRELDEAADMPMPEPPKLTRARSLLRSCLELDPHCYDAQCLLVLSDAITQDQALEQLTSIEQEAHDWCLARSGALDGATVDAWGRDVHAAVAAHRGARSSTCSSRARATAAPWSAATGCSTPSPGRWAGRAPHGGPHLRAPRGRGRARRPGQRLRPLGQCVDAPVSRDAALQARSRRRGEACGDRPCQPVPWRGVLPHLPQLRAHPLPCPIARPFPKVASRSRSTPRSRATFWWSTRPTSSRGPTLSTRLPARPRSLGVRTGMTCSSSAPARSAGKPAARGGRLRDLCRRANAMSAKRVKDVRCPGTLASGVARW